jgi:hypothetical protein
VNGHDSDLEPQSEPGQELLPVWEYIPTGAPEEFGFPQPSATHKKRQVWQRQEAFLEAYRRIGKIGKAAQAVGLTRWAVDHWLKNDVFSFKKRIDGAHADFCEEHIEQMIEDRLEDPKGNRGSDILLMFRAKAEMPEKYREEVKVLGVETQVAMLDRLRQMAMKERERQETLESPSVEGEFREVRSEPPGPGDGVKG